MSAMVPLTDQQTQFILKAGTRGLPPAVSAVRVRDIEGLRWHAAAGEVNLPLLTIDLQVDDDNRATMLGICRAVDCDIAPHGKTPMSPALAADLVTSGAWGVSVADLRQAEVMLSHGINRILIANEIGGKFAVARLARLVAAFPQADLHLFVDSANVIRLLSRAWGADPALPPIKLLFEVGCGRGGANSNKELNDILDEITTLSTQASRVSLAGIGAYEGTASRPNEVELLAALDDLFARVAYALRSVRAAVGADRALILSMGGSSLFDYVIARCRPLLAEDENARLLLRSGSCFFGDHGIMRARLEAITKRALLDEDILESIKKSFQPALRLWSEVLSLNGSREAICGFGMRDVAHDQGLPVPLSVWREGRKLRDFNGEATVSKLNDQHAFVKICEFALEIGDVIELGIKHPCTTIDKHDAIYDVDRTGFVVRVFPTHFG
jgi:D-serine dehydratase